MRPALQKKLKNKKGFTLAELLIVIAIIGILVAIAIPTFSAALKRAEEAVEVANARSTYAEGMVEYLTHGRTTFDVTYGDKSYTFTYTGGTSEWTVTVDPKKDGVDVFNKKYSNSGASDAVNFSDVKIDGSSDK